MARKRLNKGRKLKPGKKLTDRERSFVERMADPSVKSATQAAIDAGYSQKSARVIASQNLTKLNIRAAIEKRKADVARHSKVKPEAVLGATVMRAFASIDDCLDENGHFDINIARETGGINLVQSISRTQTKYGESIRFQMYSAAEAQRELGDYLELKRFPRECEENLRWKAQALCDYLADYPEASREQAFRVFARGANVTVEEMQRAVDSLDETQEVGPA